MSPDTQQNLFYSLYFLVLHNFIAIVYSLGILVSGIINFWKPKRTWFLIFLGCIVLLFSFEYNKHILESLREQTLNSLITERQSYRIERVVNVTLAKLLPTGLMILGWIMVGTGLFFEFFGQKKIKQA